jgi:hypothetical protein
MMSWDQDTYGQIRFFILIIIIFPCTLRRANAAVAVIIITLGAETLQAECALEFRNDLF